MPHESLKKDSSSSTQEKPRQLSKSQRAMLKDIFRLGKIKKGSVANHIEMHSTGFSEATSLSGHRNIDSQKWVEALEYIETELNTNHKKNHIDNDAYKKCVDFIDLLKDKPTTSIENTDGSLSAEATNYQQRDCDILLTQRLERKTAYFWVSGGAKKGKSSLLNRAEKECQKRSIHFHRCDFEKMLEEQKLTTELSEIFCYRFVLEYLFLHSTGIEMQLIADGFHELGTEFKQAFKQWRNGATSSDDNYFIAIDHIDFLLSPFVEKKLEEKHLERFDPAKIIHFILQACLTLSRELKGITFAITMEDYLYVNSKTSPLVTQASQIELKALSCEEMVTLWRHCKRPESKRKIGLAQAEIINNTMGGNPSLVQRLFRELNSKDNDGKTLIDLLNNLKKNLKYSPNHNANGYWHKTVATLQKISALSKIIQDMEAIEFDDLVNELLSNKLTKIPPQIHHSLVKQGFFDDANKLMPVVEIVLNEIRTGTNND